MNMNQNLFDIFELLVIFILLFIMLILVGVKIGREKGYHQCLQDHKLWPYENINFDSNSNSTSNK